MIDDKKETKKLEIIRNKEFVDEYLYERGLSTAIAEHPRYESILWKLSNLIRKSECNGFSDKAKDVLNSVVNMETNGSIILFEGINSTQDVVTSKYYIDDIDDKLRRLRTEIDRDGNIKTVTLSLYNDDGIEEALATEQNTEYGKYFSKATRVPNRLDVIKIERVRNEKGNLKKLDDFYQIRTFLTGLEDIYPDIEEIDPLDIMHFSILGVPPIYEDLPEKVQKSMGQNNDKILPLPENEREEIFKEYKRLNDMYGRNKSYEKAMAKALVVKSNIEK